MVMARLRATGRKSASRLIAERIAKELHQSIDEYLSDTQDALALLEFAAAAAAAHVPIRFAADHAAAAVMLQ